LESKKWSKLGDGHITVVWSSDLVLTDNGPSSSSRSDATENISRLRIKALELSVEVVLVISYIFCRPTPFSMHHSSSSVLFTDGQCMKRRCAIDDLSSQQADGMWLFGKEMKWQSNGRAGAFFDRR
jgi:hypothetical protein